MGSPPWGMRPVSTQGTNLLRVADRGYGAARLFLYHLVEKRRRKPQLQVGEALHLG